MPMHKREVEKVFESERDLTSAVFGGDEYEEVQDGAEQEAEHFWWGARFPGKQGLRATL